jgi:hypothetical protein
MEPPISGATVDILLAEGEMEPAVFLHPLTLRKQCSIKNFFLFLIRLQFLVCLAWSLNAQLQKLKVFTKQGIKYVRQY